jgi:hypothetical protein
VSWRVGEGEKERVASEGRPYKGRDKTKKKKGRTKVRPGERGALIEAARMRPLLGGVLDVFAGALLGVFGFGAGIGIGLQNADGFVQVHALVS